ncbi:MAG: Hsp20/alpha crystallin family protein [Calditrichaceae bacterium]
MTIVRWAPKRGMMNLKDDMDRMFEDFFGSDVSPVENYNSVTPIVNVEETENDFMVSAELPGMTKDDIKITFQNNSLTISGEKKSEKDFKDANYHRYERRYGKFCRSISIPSSIVADKIEADYKNGVLMVNLPKAEEVKPKLIDIKVK